MTKRLLVLAMAIGLSACHRDRIFSQPEVTRLLVTGPRGDTVLNIAGASCTWTTNDGIGPEVSIYDADGLYHHLYLHSRTGVCLALPRKPTTP